MLFSPPAVYVQFCAVDGSASLELLNTINAILAEFWSPLSSLYFAFVSAPALTESHITFELDVRYKSFASVDCKLKNTSNVI